MSLFYTDDAALADFKIDRLAGIVRVYLGGEMPRDEYLRSKLAAAEADLTRALGVPLAPTEILTDEPDAAKLTELGNTPYIVEPGYDLPPEFFSMSGGFGTLSLRVRPVIQIRSIKLVYPSFAQTVFEIPAPWIRLDKKYGAVKIIPGAGALNAPLSIFMTQALSAGYTVPHMIKVAYRAGVDASSPDFADVRDMIFRMATLSVLKNSFIPQSGSISADGLSQSTSADIGKMAGEIDDDIQALKQKLVGPVWGVL